MKTITFTYTKPDKSVSDRTLLATVVPGNMYAGIDLTSIGPEQGAKFVNEYEKLHNDFIIAVKELQAEYDLKHNYRQFKQELMSDIIEI